MGTQRNISRAKLIKQYQAKLQNATFHIFGSLLSARHAYLTGKDKWIKEPCMFNRPSIVEELLSEICFDCMVKHLAEGRFPEDYDDYLLGNKSFAINPIQHARGNGVH